MPTKSKIPTEPTLLDRQPVPESLGVTGAGVWRSVASLYLLRVDERIRLEAAAKMADTLQMLEETWRALGYPMVSLGSMKQEVIHPLIGEIRQQRAALDRALQALKLPDLDEGGAQPAANQQRSAAQSRWAVPGSRGA